MVQSTFPPFSVDDFANNPVISMIGCNQLYRLCLLMISLKSIYYIA